MLRFRNTFILILVAISVVLYFYLVEKPGERAKQKAQERAKQVFTFDGDNVYKIVLTRESGKVVFVKKEKDTKNSEEDWWIEEPIKADADDYTADGIVNRFERLEIEKVIEEKGVDLTVFQLQPPKYTVEFYLKGSTEPATIFIGKRSPVGFKVYAMKKGESKVFLVSAGVESNLNKKVKDYRNKKIFDFLYSDVSDLYITKRGSKTIRVAKVNGEEYWLKNFVNGNDVKADKSVVTRTLSALRDLRVKDFVNDVPTESDLRKYGLLDPQFRVEVVLEGGKKAELLLGRRTGDKDKVYAKRGDQPNVYTVSADILAKIDKRPYQWRVKKIFDFYTWKAERLYISDKYGATYAVKKKNGKWYDEKGEKEKDKSVINKILSMLRDLTVVDYIAVNPDSLSPYGLDKPKIHVRVKVEGELEDRGLFIGEETSHGVYAMLEGGNEVYLVKKDFLDDFEKERFKILDAGEVPSPQGGKSPKENKSKESDKGK